MKRDMDLVRKILLAIEEQSYDYSQPNPAVDGYTTEQIEYHLLIMIDAKLIVGFEFPVGGGPKVFSERMTWQGHDFLEASRDEGRWSKAKGIMTKIGGVTFEIMKQILTQVMSDQVKQIMGINP